MIRSHTARWQVASVAALTTLVLAGATYVAAGAGAAPADPCDLVDAATDTARGLVPLDPPVDPDAPGSATRARSGAGSVLCEPTDDEPTDDEPTDDDGRRGDRPYFQAADWLWDPVPDEPELDPESAEMVELLADGEHFAATGEFGVTLRGPETVTDDTPRFPVSFSQNWGPDPFGDNEMPIPEGTPIASGSDGHLAVADPLTNQVYNLWMAQDGGDSWSAGWGAMTPLDGDGRELNGSSTGAGIARFAAVVRAEEIAAGEIPHALFFATDMVRPEEVRYPATKTDGSNMAGVSTPIPEGARVQLDPSIDLDSLDLDKGERAVAEALQTYGAYVGDNGGARMGFLFEFAPESSAYEEAGLSGDYAAMNGIPWDRLQVLADWQGGRGEGPPADDEPNRDDPPTRGDDPADDDPPSRSDDPPADDEPADDEPSPRDDEPTVRDPRGDQPRDRAPSTPAPSAAGSGRAAPLDDLGAPARPTGGRTLEVGQGGTYGSIQEAVDAARPGDTVEIAEGTYDAFSINGGGSAGKWLTVRAARGAEVVVEGGGGQGQIELNGASYVQVVGISAEGSGSHGIFGSDVDHVVLRDCAVVGSADGGIVFVGGSDVLIDGCEARGANSRGTSASHEGMSISNIDGFEVVGSEVVEGGEEGICVKDGSSNGSIHRNTVVGNRGPNIYVGSARGIDIFENEASGSTEGSKSGIGLAVESYSDVSELIDVTVRDNVIRDNVGAGVDFWIESSGTISGITIEGNRFSGNSRGAITFNGGGFSGTNVIRDNVFSGGDEPPGMVDGFRLVDNVLE